MTTPALTILKDWPRFSIQSYPVFSQASSNQFSDATGGIGTLKHALRRYSGGARLIGSALPVWTAPGDNLAPYAALKVVKPGDILVVASASYTGCALLGDHIMGLLNNAKAAGMITDGLVRDLEGLRNINLPVYAAGTSPLVPTKQGPGTVGLPISLGSVVIHPGDLVIADDDGIVIVPPAEFAQVSDKLIALRAQDAMLEQRVRSGATEPPDFEQLLERVGVRWLAPIDLPTTRSDE
jgi:4-hydroxy-4-methyl-2-oxoglutarate aldolase